MGRSAWPPNSFTEWMVGQNFTDSPRTFSGQTQLLKVSLSEDEASGDEKLEITFPRRRRSGRTAKQASPEAVSSRKVRFDRDRRPLKSALKKSASPSESSDTLVDGSSEESATADEDSSSIEESDTSDDEVWVRKMKRQERRRVKLSPVCEKLTDSEDSSTVENDLPHPTCHCKDCAKGRKILKAMIKLEARKEAAKDEPKDGGKDKEKSKGKGKGKGKGKKTEDTSTEASETTQTEETEDDKKEESSKKKKNKKGSPKEKDQTSTAQETQKESLRAADTPKTVNKDAFRLPKYPKSMEPNLIMPVRSKVLQCEHTIEGPHDPRPNAFIDSGKGIVRVYHGPTWGNHTGELYGSLNPAKMPSPIPPSAIPPPGFHGYPPGPPGYYGPPPYGPFPPYPHAGPPPGTPFGKNMPQGPPPNWPNAMDAQKPDDAAMKEAAAKGLGLTGQAWPQTPDMIREERAREQQEKAKSEAANNVGPSQEDGSWKAPQDGANTGWNSGANQGWGDKGNNGNDAWGNESTKGVAQQHDFTTWGANKGGFERSGGAGNGWTGDQGGNNAWSGSANNGKQSLAASHHTSKPPFVHLADGTPGNGGGSNAWGAQETGNDNQNWGSGSNKSHGWKQDNAGNGNGWNDAGGSNRDGPQEGAGGNTWGGPPGSKPHSRHPSRPPSNAGGWGNTGWSASNENNVASGPMPGAWVENGGQQSRKPSGGSDRPPDWNQHNKNYNGGGGGGGHSRRGSPNEPLVGAFAWPEGYGPPAGPGNNGWNNNGGYKAPKGSPAVGWTNGTGGNGAWGGPPGSRAPSQAGGGGWDGQSKQGGSPPANWNSGGGGGGAAAAGWDDNPSNNAGPTHSSWANPDLAQDTGGKADNW
ncbi:hypothetical protein VPNG_05920 [Cytospora leucostoma]|uniref:Uncharacterized protein n=1 Tax=Cytospora leucostoma TaxID=1230097 RepID=A0A423XB25_9PEZI|nr:hypothetical protein VPNG_05920 [Cytospora leucostoma]